MDLTWIYICLYGFPILLIVCLGIIAAWIIWEKWVTPQEAKEVRYAKRKKKPLVIHAGDEGFIKFETLNIIEKEGFGATDKEKKNPFVGFFARTIEEITKKDATATEKITNLINKLASKKAYLQDAKIPVWVAYTGKSILTSIYSLAGLDIAKDLPNNPTPNLVDLQEIKSLFHKPWDQTLIRTGRRVAKQEGIFEQKKFSGVESWKSLVVPVGIILALVMGVMVIAIVFFR